MGDSFLSWLRNYFDKWRLCLLVFAIAYGIALTINLSYKSMEWDEVTHFTGGLLLSRGQLGQWVWTNSLYPPVFDIVTAIYYLAAGPSVFAGRLVAVTFSVLSVFVVYELANKLYNNKKTAFVSAVLFGVMPGIIWLSRMAMIETMLIFIFSVSMLFFYNWTLTGKERDRVISVVALALGVAVKYQMLVVVPIIMLIGMCFWKKSYLKTELKRYLQLPRLALVVAAIVVVAVVAYALLASGVLSTLIYAIQVGTADRAVYSVRYPTPIFYFIEMTYSNGLMHPISLLPYLLGLAGLGLFAYRRKREDKFLLLWFAVVYVVFTLIPNRDWRYVTVAFPVLAIAASNLLVSSLGKLPKTWQTAKAIFPRKWVPKLAAAFLVAFTVAGVFYSCVDAYTWVAADQVYVPVDQATSFAAQTLLANQTLVVACPVNRFNKYMVGLYLNIENSDSGNNQTWQYPNEAVDSYTPDFNSSEFVALCQQCNAKYVLLYDWGGNWQYFNSTLTPQIICGMLTDTGRFALETTFGEVPNRILALSFT